MADEAKVQTSESNGNERKNGDVLISVRKVSKVYQRGGERLEVLKDLDLDVREGAFEALMGPSGSGKSTLLNLIAGLDRPSGGSVSVAGADLGSMSEGERARW